jgi:hypothetical protein
MLAFFFSVARFLEATFFVTLSQTTPGAAVAVAAAVAAAAAAAWANSPARILVPSAALLPAATTVSCALVLMLLRHIFHSAAERTHAETSYARPSVLGRGRGLVLVRLECPLWVKRRHVRRNRSCPLYPRKRTCAVLGMSAKGQNQTLGLRRLCLEYCGRGE